MGIFQKFSKSSKVKVIKGILYAIGRKGKRINFHSLDDALNYLAKCCGVDCCNQVLIMKDHTTDELMVGYFDNGAWVVETKADFFV